MSKHEQRQKFFEEFDFKEKAGSAWSHNYLNQKPWHPMSYPNQRRKWIAEQMHGLQTKRTVEIEKEVSFGLHAESKLPSLAYNLIIVQRCLFLHIL